MLSNLDRVSSMDKLRLRLCSDSSDGSDNFDGSDNVNSSDSSDSSDNFDSSDRLIVRIGKHKVL